VIIGNPNCAVPDYSGRLWPILVKRMAAEMSILTSRRKAP